MASQSFNLNEATPLCMSVPLCFKYSAGWETLCSFSRVPNKNPRLTSSLLLLTVKWTISCKNVSVQKATFTTIKGFAPFQKVQTRKASKCNTTVNPTHTDVGITGDELAVITTSGFQLSQHYELSTYPSQEHVLFTALSGHNPANALVRLMGNFTKWQAQIEFRTKNGS